jgi:anti-sigma regulatory factor (Ser/Thr protein kinase)
MFAKVTLNLIGPLDRLRLVWQTGETLLEAVVFDEDPEAARYNVLVALQEMVTNVMRHGYQSDHSRPIVVAFELTDDSLAIELRDQGPPFDPLQYDTSALDADESMPTQCGGHGIRIVRQVMDKVEYQRDDGWNVLRLTKWGRAIASI